MIDITNARAFIAAQLTPRGKRMTIATALSHRQRVAWACDCAERALHKIDDEDTREHQRGVLGELRRWVSGDDSVDLAELRGAAYATTAYAGYASAADAASYYADASADELTWQIDCTLHYLCGTPWPVWDVDGTKGTHQ